MKHTTYFQFFSYTFVCFIQSQFAIVIYVNSNYTCWLFIRKSALPSDELKEYRNPWVTVSDRIIKSNVTYLTFRLSPTLNYLLCNLVRPFLAQYRERQIMNGLPLLLNFYLSYSLFCMFMGTSRILKLDSFDSYTLKPASAFTSIFLVISRH